MSKYRMSLDSGWESNAFEPFKEVEFKTADRKTIVYSKVVRGEWIKMDKRGNNVRCSKCGNTLDLRGVNAGRGDANFCPNCGAKMSTQSNAFLTY